MSCEGNVSTYTGGATSDQSVPSGSYVHDLFRPFPQYSNGSTCAPDESQMKRPRVSNHTILGTRLSSFEEGMNSLVRLVGKNLQMRESSRLKGALIFLPAGPLFM